MHLKHLLIGTALSITINLQAQNKNLLTDYNNVMYPVANQIALNAAEWKQSIAALNGATQREQWKNQVRERNPSFIGTYIGETEKRQLKPIKNTTGEQGYSPTIGVLSPSHYFYFYAPKASEKIKFSFRKLNGGPVRVHIFSNKGPVTDEFINLAENKSSYYTDQYVQLNNWFVMEQGATSKTIEVPGSSALVPQSTFYAIVVESFSVLLPSSGQANTTNSNEVVEIISEAVGSPAPLKGRGQAGVR